RKRRAANGRRVDVDRPTAGGNGAAEWEGEAQRGMESTLVGLLGFIDPRLAGRGRIAGRDAFRLDFGPQPGVPARNEIEKVARSAAGTAWVDAAEFHVLRVDAALAAPVR